MRAFVFYTMFSFFLFQKSLAQPDKSSASHCSGPDVIHISRSYDSYKGDSSTFDYSFKYKKGKDPEAPVVIFLPGGPGQTSMNDADVGIPEDFGIVFTDPRSIGCNGGTRPIGDDFYSSEKLASDILAIVRALNLQDYYLYGISYGTVLATIAASKAREFGVQIPRAVILEGVVGRALAPGEYLRGYIEQWTLTRKHLSNEIIRQLDVKAPLGITNNLWGGWIEEMLLLGVLPGQGNALETTLMALFSPNTPPQFAQWLRNMIINRESDIPTNVERLYLQIMCREINDQVVGIQTDFILDYGHLSPMTDRICGDLHLTKPFDSARWQISSQIFYFQGENDPATPLFLSQYHFEHQMASKKHFVGVIGGGHNSLSANLQDCKGDLWNDILLNNGKDIESILRNCKNDTSFTVSNKE